MIDNRGIRYPKEFKERALKAVLEGKESISAIARNHKVSDWTVRRWEKEILASTIEPSAEKSTKSMSTLRLLQNSLFPDWHSTFSGSASTRKPFLAWRSLFFRHLTTLSLSFFHS